VPQFWPRRSHFSSPESHLLIGRTLRALFSGRTKGHFGQYGEDIVIRKMFPRNQTTGTYVDIGAFHPFYFSNTAYLWLKGWSGINVDANQNSIRLFERVRPSDTNVLGAVVSSELAKTQKTVQIFLPEDRINAMGTCDAATAAERGYSRSVEIPAITVASILQQVRGREIDFLNIDIEGLDEVVLSEIDFQTHRPKVICVEDYSGDVQAASTSRIAAKLASVGYTMKARVGPSSIFQAWLNE
jgi:FkbM family methyltransferase